MKHAVLALLLVGCGADATAVCPVGYRADSARAQSVLDHLSDTTLGRRLLADVDGRRPAICFGPRVDGVWEQGGRLLLPSVATEKALAARVGHLLRHLADGEPELTPGDCEDYIRRAVDFERRGRSAERSLLRSFGEPGEVPAASTMEPAYRSRCR